MSPVKDFVLATFESHGQAPIRELRKSGFDIKKQSIIGKDDHTEESVVGYHDTGDRMKTGSSWARSGEASGGCCSDRRSAGSRASGRCSWRGRS